MKTTAIVSGLLIAVAVILGTILWNRKHNEDVCINQMRQWAGAAESYCLAEKHGPADVLRLENLAPYVKYGMKQAVCPNGGLPYAPFTVANGPVCPNGHDMEPGIPRPFRTQPGQKLAGIYEAAGWTHLIDKIDRGTN